MKKGEKRGGDYTVTLYSDKKCCWCGKTLKKGRKATRYYLQIHPIYVCLERDDNCIECCREIMGIDYTIPTKNG